MVSKARIKKALAEVDHYRALADDALAGGDLENAHGWLVALCTEVAAQIDGFVASEQVAEALGEG